jgi:pyroglutamyl-peptidase
MKMTLILILLSAPVWSRPLVLVSHFDAFGKASFNNSEVIAKKLEENFKDSEIDLRLCPLRTAFDQSFYALEDCLKGLEDSPKLVLGLGESNCNLKIETLGRNLDKTIGPDNDGVERSSTPIVSHGPEAIGFSYPLQEMYCSLSSKDRSKIEVSNNAGSFVCNNLAYQFSYHYDDVPFGFIHIPSNNCSNLNKKTETAIQHLTQMIKVAVESKNTQRLPTTKNELTELRASTKGQECLNEFYNRAKGIDEKSFWIFSKKE